MDGHDRVSVYGRDAIFYLFRVYANVCAHVHVHVYVHVYVLRVSAVRDHVHVHDRVHVRDRARVHGTSLSATHANVQVLHATPYKSQY